MVTTLYKGCVYIYEKFCSKRCGKHIVEIVQNFRDQSAFCH